MKYFVFLFICCFCTTWQYAQQSYTVNGEVLELKTELDGELDLLWNIIDNNYRYFVRISNGTITELKNTKDQGNKYQEEYKSVLNELTAMNTDKLKLTLYSLRSFLDSYNATKDTDYQIEDRKGRIGLRLGFSGGVTNNPFVSNPDNTIVPLIGAELEIHETNSSGRHSGFTQVRHAFENDEFMYSATELSLGYRYRVINKDKFSLYAQVKFATLSFTNATIIDTNAMELSISDTAFDIPLIFGLGADIAIGDKGYITIIYGELFGVFLENQGNFPTDISLGYKFDL